MSASGSTRRPVSPVDTVTHDNERLVPQVWREFSPSTGWNTSPTSDASPHADNSRKAARDFLRGICQYLCSAIWKIFKVSRQLYTPDEHDIWR